mgnify:CR=1 FL=1
MTAGNASGINDGAGAVVLASADAVKAGNLKGSATAAETSVYLAASPDVAEVSGSYFYEKKVIPASEAAMDRGAAERLCDPILSPPYWAPACHRGTAHCQFLCQT